MLSRAGSLWGAAGLGTVAAAIGGLMSRAAERKRAGLSMGRERRLRAGALTLAALACGGGSADDAAQLDTRSANLAGAALAAKVRRIGTDPALERSGHSLLAVRNKLHVVRGVRDDFETQTNTFPADVLRVHPRSGKVRELVERGQEQPGGLAHSCAAGSSAEPAFYLFGGANYVFELDPDFFASLVVSDVLYRFDVPRRRWSAIEPRGARPGARSGCSAHFVGEDMYMFAGISRFFEVNAELWRFDAEASAWALLEPEGPVPPPRYKPAAALDAGAGKIYYYGGLAFGAEGFARLDDFWVYDVASNCFRELPSGIQPVRDQGSMGVLQAPGGKRYVVYVGGDLPTDVSCTGFPQLARATSEVWAFDIEEETWGLLETPGGMPRIQYHSGATHDNRFYFAGGWAEEPAPVQTCRQEWNPHFFELSLTSH